MATAPPPAKIKAHLATIKEQFLDDQEAETAKNPEDLYHGLLSMELLLRGVIVQDNSKLWQQVQASIGKVLLTTDNTPKPLLAGAHVMAGRVAEACPKIQQKIFSKDCTQALQRAQDIKDERWLILLKQEFDPLQIAQGYFVGAALIQTDTPPMWKKVWDLWSQRTFQSQPFEAQVALENLMRIAASKGNQTRVAELQLQLIQSYLNKPTICNDLVSQAFGDTVTPKLPSDPQVLAEVAKKTLFECQIQDLAAGANLILYQILQVQVGMALETATIQRLAQEKQTLDKNRSVSTSIETCLESSRQDILSQSLDSVQMQALSLRDTVVAGWSKQNPNDNDGEDHWSLAVEWTRQSILRLFDRAEAAQKVATNNISTTPWKIALEYILPIMETIERQCDWSLGIARTTRMGNISQFFESTCSEEKMLVSLIVSSLPNVCWMLLAMENNNVILEDKMIFLLDSLSVLIQSSKTEDNQPKEAIGSKQQLSTDIQSWKLAQAKATCYICQDNNDIVYQVTRDAVVANKQCQDGSLGFLQCIVAWSGLYQRPWPFCSNISDARRLLRAAKVNGGRSFSTLEEILLDLAHSDAELLNGGFASDAGKRYSQIMHKLEAIKDILGNLSTTLLQAHCINGLARVCQMGVATPEQASVEEYAMKSLQLLESIEMSSDIRPLHIWYSRSLFAASISHQLSVARQLIADSLVHDGRCEEAQSFLEAAVNDAPLDADAALALGAFLLRLAFYSNTERSVEVDKAAQIQLLKAAKLDPSKANPFALLGLWFEEQGDSARAQGCYLKSLNLDSCNPVAGRGMLRLESRENLGQYLDSAVNSNSPLNGWAWRSIGLNKVFLDSEDELAVVALLKSLRCRDIALPASEPLGIFFQRPTESNINERENALAEVAMCYRRLGRYTASIRAFHAAIETAGDSVGSSLLCSCAQVELELALFDDAAGKFGRVLQGQDKTINAIAAYGQGVALMSIAQRDFQGGKAGSAFAEIQRAIDSCLNFSENFACTRKLLGDLYSFGASLPPNVFNDSGNSSADECIQKQLEFVAKGENAYRSVLGVQDFSKSDKNTVLRASSICDVASNILLQAQTLSSRHECGNALEAGRVPEVDDLYERASKEFRSAIETVPLYAPAWCGFGCAIVAKDPLLAQHAFCRCLQLEKMFSDAYANVGFLYTSQQAFKASENVMNALTQVADTPMMWMNRAFILERGAATNLEQNDSAQAERDISRAADAYRAALQVMKHPDAQLGLSVTGRMMLANDKLKDENSRSVVYRSRRKDSLALMKAFMGSTYRLKDMASLFCGVMEIEQANEALAASWSTELFKRGCKATTTALGEESMKGSINTGAVAGCLEKDENAPMEEKTNNLNFPIQVSLQRQIIHEPSRADLWLSLAKLLIGSLGQSSPPRAIESALEAANRASTMLAGELIQPHRVHGVSASYVKSEILSEGLSLVHWLGNFKNKKKEESNNKSSYELQRSLMMCPNNPLAREALKLNQ